MIRDGINTMPDMRWHVTWLQHFSSQLAEGIWYPRWIAGTNFGYGSPTFVFYPPLAYYLGSGLKALGLDTQQTIAGLFSLGLFGCGLNFYIYGRHKWGYIAALVGSFAFMTAPFLAHNIYFTARLAETFALLWIPLGLWLTDKALESSKWRVGVALFGAFFALSHVPSLLICFIFWSIYIGFKLLTKTPWKNIFWTVVSAFIGFGTVSLYLLPAILEQKYVNTAGLKAVLGGFRANLVGTPLTLNPVFLTRIQSIFFRELGLIVLFALISWVLHRRDPNKLKVLWGWLGFSSLAVLLMSYPSTPIWNASKTLQMVQFPWRMMGIFSFCLAAMCSQCVNGILSIRKKNVVQMGLQGSLLLLVLGILFWDFHYSYTLSRGIPTLNNPGQGVLDKKEHIELALNDPYNDTLVDVRPYRPLINHGYAASDPKIGQPLVLTAVGDASVDIQRWQSYERTFQATVETPAKLQIRTYFYPAWHVWVNGVEQPIKMASDGTIELSLAPGQYSIQLKYLWTSAFKLGMGLSVLSILILLGLSVKEYGCFRSNHPQYQP